MATTDWDFRYTSWEKGSDFFVSTPTSLKITLPVGAQDNNLALLKESISGALDQGRIVSQIRPRSGTTQRPLFIFRAQVSNLNFWAYDQYEVTFQVGATEWRYRDANGVVSSMGSWSWGAPRDTWTKVRVTWWNGKDGSGNAATVCRLEYWNGTSWVKASADLYDTNERNKGSSTNRVGVGVPTAPGDYINFDDTEIWRAT